MRLFMMTFTAALSALAIPAAQGDELDDFFEVFKSKREHIESIHAKFTEVTTLPDDTFRSEGTITFSKPRRLVRHTAEPRASLLVDDRTVYEYEPEIKQLDSYSVEDGPDAEILFFGFDDDLGSLRAEYEVSLFDPSEDDARGGRGLLIEPKPTQLEDRDFLEVALYLREIDYIPYKVRIVTDEDSDVVLELRNVQVNAPVDEEARALRIAAGTKVIQNNRVVTTTETELAVPPLPGASAEAAPEPAGPAASAPQVEVSPLDAPAAPVETPAAEADAP